MADLKARGTVAEVRLALMIEVIEGSRMSGCSSTMFDGMGSSGHVVAFEFLMTFSTSASETVENWKRI